MCIRDRFDTQQQVYRQIIDNLKTANELFDEANGLIYNQSGEMLYNTSKGDATGIKKWKKFCNSLRLRALLRVIDVPEFNAKQELRTMLTDPATYPVFESNDDAALLAISGTCLLYTSQAVQVHCSPILSASGFHKEVCRYPNT